MENETQIGNPPQEAATTSNTEQAASQPFWETLDQPEESLTPEPNSQGEAEQEPEAEAQEPESGEVEAEDNDYLPSEQEKIFPIETLAKYGKRYGYTLEEIQADPRIQNALKDKINSDILIQQQREAAEAAQNEEPTPEEAEPEQTAQTQTQQPLTEEQRTQWIEGVVKQGLDQKSVQKFGYNFLVAAGVDPNVPENKDVLANAGKIGETMAAGVVDLLSTLLPQFMPQLLPNVVEQVYPQFGEMYGETKAARDHRGAWEEVRSSNPQFAKLPGYSESNFKAAIEQAQKQIPNFDKIAANLQGTPRQKAVAMYSLLAGHMAGNPVTPATVKQALETGKKQQQDAERNRAAAKVLGAGQSRKQFTGPSKADEFRNDILAYNEMQRSTPMKG